MKLTIFDQNMWTKHSHLVPTKTGVVFHIKIENNVSHKLDDWKQYVLRALCTSQGDPLSKSINLLL
jgi:hypothetical protein